MSVGIARSADQVQDELLALLPDGWASTHDPDVYIAARYKPVADQFAAIEASAVAMLPEIDPRAAPHLLPDWERVLGPDPCQRDTQAPDTVSRGLVAYERLVNAGTVCAGYFERAALAIGETLTITEYPPPELGLMQCGASMLVQAPHHMDFLVTLPATRVVRWICGATQCGESLGTFTPSLMECVIRNEAPLHATPYFSFVG